MEKKIINEAIEMTKGIPGKDILVPVSQEETNLTPPPKIEYMVIEATSIEKVVRDVNTQLGNGWQTEGGITVANGPVTKFYQTMVRRNVDSGVTISPAPLYIPGLEDEPDLYEDIEKDVDE